MEKSVLSIEELAQQSDTPVRTIRFYISQGLLPPPQGRGKGASYDEEHLLRLRLIRRLAEHHTPLAEIRQMLAGVGLDGLRQLLSEEDERERCLRDQGPQFTGRELIAQLLAQAEEKSRSFRVKTLCPTPPMTRSAQPLEQGTPGLPGDSWQRIELVPGVELHVRSDAQERERRLIERLLRAAKGPIKP